MIKKGALVKAWDDDAKEFAVGRFVGTCVIGYLIEDTEKLYLYNNFQNAIEIPEELAKQLEWLGNTDLDKAKSGCGKVNSSGGWTTFCGEKTMGEGMYRCDDCQDVFDKYIGIKS